MHTLYDSVDNKNPESHMRYFIDLIKDLLLMLWQGFGAILWLGAVVVAAVSISPWIYHPIFIAGFLMPSVYFTYYAFKKRSEDSNKRQRVIDNIGTFLSLVIAAFFFAAYIGCLYLKMS